MDCLQQSLPALPPYPLPSGCTLLHRSVWRQDTCEHGVMWNCGSRTASCAPSCRTNLAYASFSMTKDLNFSPSVYGTGKGKGHLGWCLCQMSSFNPYVLNLTLLINRVRFVLCRLFFSHGSLTANWPSCGGGSLAGDTGSNDVWGATTQPISSFD